MMDTPPSPPAQPSTEEQPYNNNNPPHQTTSPSDIPLTSPLRTYPKRLLPHSLSSTYPHGHISGHARSPSAQAAFEARRAEILRTMSTKEIEKAYEDVAGRVKAVLAESEERRMEVEGEIEKLRGEREMERRVWERVMKGMKG